MRRVFSMFVAIALGILPDSHAADPSASARSKQTPLARQSAETLPASWTEGLRSGPNGPIPLIVVDQFGYPTRSAKFAIIRDPHVGYDAGARFVPGETYALVNVETGQVTKKAGLVPWNGGAVHPASGDKAWTFDFSDVVAPGRYAVLDVERRVRSAEFAIGDEVYRAAMKHALRMFFYQRAGFAKTPAFAGQAWADAASHLGPGQDQQSRAWTATQTPKRPANETTVRDLRGGWYDAGDYNKYTSWTARAIIVLLRAFEENPQAFGDNSGIPESGNGVPDILDEVKWGLDWLMRMQGPDGALLCVQGLAGGSPPSSAKGGSFHGPATTAATLMGTAAFAYASKIYTARAEPGLRAYGAELAQRAKRAWAWATANPRALYYNNDSSRQPGSQGLAAGQQEMSDRERQHARVEAAIYLYEISREATLRDEIEPHIASLLPPHGPTLWEVDGHEALLYYTRVPGASDVAKRTIREALLTKLTAQVLAADTSQTDPYRSPISDYTWGSNKAKAAQGRLWQLVALHAESPEARAAALAAALNYAHYIHGLNPLGLVYLTNMRAAGASHSATTMFHAWFAKGTRWEQTSVDMPGPPPGYLVGGPTGQYGKDGCCKAPTPASGYQCHSKTAAAVCERSYAPPLGQPPMKAYLQFNDPWPANSWSITEPSMAYQAQYIRALAPYVR